MPVRVLIVGAGGQGRIVADILLAAAPASGLLPVGFVDDGTPPGTRLLDLVVLGAVDRLAQLPHDAVVVAIGDNNTREALSLALERQGERIVTARHPFTSVAHDVQIGAGAMISAGAVITPGARIGRGVLLNTASSVDHDSIVEAFAHVSVGATVGANAFVGERALIGVAAAVMTGRRVGADCLVGAGALVTRDLPSGVVAAGVPARVRRAPR